MTLIYTKWIVWWTNKTKWNRKYRLNVFVNCVWIWTNLISKNWVLLYVMECIYLSCCFIIYFFLLLFCSFHFLHLRSCFVFSSVFDVCWRQTRIKNNYLYSYYLNVFVCFLVCEYMIWIYMLIEKWHKESTIHLKVAHIW